MEFGGMVAPPLAAFDCTVATLPTASAQCLSQYAKVTDLYGELTDLVRCICWTRAGVTKYAWRPVLAEWKASLPIASMTLSALKTPTELRFTGALATTQVLTMDSVGAYPGLTFEVRGDFTGVGGMSFAGMDVLSPITSILAGGSRRISFDGAGWSTR